MNAAPDAVSPVIMLLIMLPAFALGIVQLVCLVMVIVKMFQKGETGIGIASAVLSVCTGIGVLIAFIYGWIKSSEWGLKKVMVIWTACFVLNIVLVVLAALAGALAAVNLQPAPQMQNMQNI